MNKKGMTWSTIIYAIIAVIVLVTIVWMFRKQIDEIYRSLVNIIKITTGESEQVGKGLREVIETNK